VTDFTQILAPYPSLAHVAAVTLQSWPEHRRYLDARFKADTPEFLARTEEFATLALKNIEGALETYVADYRWMCERFSEEELFFFREDRYRLSTFAEAYEQVYSNDAYMSRYVRGILISQMLWDPHARAFDLFRTEFLASFKDGARYLEVGPGHGFFLAFASNTPAVARLEAWDVSESSIAETRKALAQLGVTREITIVEQDVLKAPSRHEEFDAAVISEVLEHLERPDLALQTLHAALVPGGRIFINVPINSPAPDHIYLWRSQAEFHDFVRAQGFTIDTSWDLPMTGYTLERAVKNKGSISCIVIASKR
jgi:2-polyprenyl-3-methyl-5-hydroxy-6-metoxy-1,4-benzoquinol methylase